MPVYVDDMEAPLGRMKMCHMVADTRAELLAMCDKIGVQRKQIQKRGTYLEHFDISLGKKAQAIKHGAIAVTRRELYVRVIQPRTKRPSAEYLGEPETHIQGFVVLGDRKEWRRGWAYQVVRFLASDAFPATAGDLKRGYVKLWRLIDNEWQVVDRALTVASAKRMARRQIERERHGTQNQAQRLR